MNNENPNWRCTNCDTINIGRRCVVCGAEKPEISARNSASGQIRSTVPQKDAPKKNTRVIIALSAVIGVLLIAIILVVFSFFGKDGEEAPPEKTLNSHEISGGEKEEETESEKVVYVSDQIYNIKFNLSVDKHSMDKHPGFDEKKNADIEYSVPMNFKSESKHSYTAYDDTAHIKFFFGSIADDTSVSEIMEEEKKAFGGGNLYETLGNDWYVISKEMGDIIYYRKEVIGEGKRVGFIFIYPSEYKDIYDDYVSEIANGLSLPDTSGVEVIEEEI